MISKLNNNMQTCYIHLIYLYKDNYERSSSLIYMILASLFNIPMKEKNNFKWKIMSSQTKLLISHVNINSHKILEHHDFHKRKIKDIP